MSKMSQRAEQLKDSMKQNWVQNYYNRTYSDQFGFTITYGAKYTLYYKEREVYSFRSLQAAQMTSTIIINDKILNADK